MLRTKYVFPESMNLIFTYFFFESGLVNISQYVDRLTVLKFYIAVVTRNNNILFITFTFCLVCCCQISGQLKKSKTTTRSLSVIFTRFSLLLVTAYIIHNIQYLVQQKTKVEGTSGSEYRHRK